MTFDEYEKRKWRITANGSEAKCKEGDIVIFDGGDDKVNVRCATKRYGDGQFKSPQEGEQEGTIEVDGYVIRMESTNGKRRITFEKADQQAFAGSWTAEDYVPPGSASEPAGE